MRHFLIFVLFFWGISYSAPQTPLKIIQIVPFGERNIKITFNREITSKDVKQTKISDLRGVLDIRAILTIERKNYFFRDGSQAQIAQQDKTTTRVLLQAPKKLQYQLRFSDKHLYIDLIPAKFVVLPTTTPPKTPSKPSSKPHKTQKVKPPSKPKKQRKIVIDAGHGGKDCGAIGVAQVCEKVITLDVAKLLESELKSRGYIVYMTRTDDAYIGLRERTKFANDKNADLFISIHANSIPKTSKSSPKGVETYFFSRTRSERVNSVVDQEYKDDIEATHYETTKEVLSSKIDNINRQASEKLAIDIQEGIRKAMHQDYPGVVDEKKVMEGPFWVLFGSLRPSVLIEIGYISHPQEGQRITQKAYQKLLVKGIADGIKGYFVKNP